MESNGAYTSWECEWGGMRMDWEWGMRMKFQCLLGKNKWEWKCAGMPLMCLLGKINRNENQFTKISIVLIINKNN